MRYGLDLATLRNWEQGRSAPDAAASTLLWTIARNPAAVEESLDMDGPSAAVPTVRALRTTVPRTR